MAASPGRFIVLDVETQRGFNEVDRKKIHLLKISVACIYDSKTDSYHSFEEKELLKLEEILKQADLIVGFNIRDFDMEVLAPYFMTPVKNFPVLDLLVEFEKVRGHRISLQSLAQATLKSSKSGTGWDALQLFKDGRMDELKKYCIDDVKITKDVYEYGIKHGKVLFISNRDYQTHEVPVTWANAMEEMKAQKKADTSFPTSLF
ncbi:MAG TPA: ribonuclease H-like domain-containing protein [Candidatus Omnitrophota bacterium]|nr:ribonuclease H-like domain-containing protein [Candidatus Omnitrophota bacterium]